MIRTMLPWILGFALLAPPDTAWGQSSILPDVPSTFGPIRFSTDLAAGDLDRDGDLDLVWGTLGGAWIFWNDRGSFLDAEELYVEESSSGISVALGDLDGDGWLDVVLGRTGGSLLVRNDAGGFDALHPVWTSPGDDTRDVALADLDDDGDLDLVTANVGLDAVYENTDGVLSDLPTWLDAKSTSSHDIAIADVDGDGDLDLAFARSAPNTGTQVLRNDANVFTEMLPADLGYARGVAFGDMDGDGDQDLVTASLSEARTYFNTQGTFSESDSLHWEKSTVVPSKIALGDLDKDGDLDGLFGDLEGPAALHLNRQIETGTPRMDLDWQAPQIGLGAMTLADLDGDGWVDVAVGNQSSRLRVYRNLAPGRFVLMDWTPSAARARGATLGDVDEDGDLDLVLAIDGGPSQLFRNAETAFGPAEIIAPAAHALSVAVAPFDADGTPDLLVAGMDGCVLLPGDPAGFLDPVWTSQTGPARFGSFVDVDGDGAFDIVCGEDGPSAIYLNLDGAVDPNPHWVADSSVMTIAMVAGDLGGDLHLELVSLDVDSTRVYANDGGMLARAASQSFLAGQVERSLALGDVDGDGDLDLLAAYANSIVMHGNTGGSLDASPVGLDVNTDRHRAIALLDADGDSDLDLVVTTSREDDRLFFNVDGSFSSQTTSDYWDFGAGYETFGLTAGDIDRDGDLDLVFADQDTPSRAYLSTRTPAFAGDAGSPTHHLPNNPPFLRRGRITRTGLNLYSVEVDLVDVESDPVAARIQYSFEGESAWYDAIVPTDLDGLVTSPAGSPFSFTWETESVPFDPRRTILRISLVPRSSVPYPTQHVGTYEFVLEDLRLQKPRVEVACEGVSPCAGLDFRTLTLGDTRTLPLTVHNTGTSPLQIVSATYPRADMRVLSIPASIPPGGSASLTLELAPRSGTTRDACRPGPATEPHVLTLTTDDPSRPTVDLPIDLEVVSLQVETRAAVTDGHDAPLGEPLVVFVSPCDEVSLEGGALAYRPRGTTGFATTDLLPMQSGDWFAEIPAVDVTERGVEYYVVLANGPVDATDPENAPASLYFQAVESPVASALAVEIAPVGGDPQTPVRVGDDVAVTVSFPTGAEFVSGSLFHRRGGQPEYGDPVAASERAEWIIPGEDVTEAGVEYRIEIVTASDTLSIPDPGDPPSTLRVRIDDLDMGSTARGRYRMLSVPVVFEGALPLAELLTDDLGLYESTRWRLFQYSPVSSGNVELCSSPQGCSGVGEFEASPGRAFWLVTRDPVASIDTGPVPGRSTPSSGPYEIPLGAGWNQIGNPFTFPVAWDQVEKPGDMTLHHYGSDGSYRSSLLLEPHDGYFVFAEESTVLRVPPRDATVSSVLRRVSDPETGGWRARLVASSDARYSVRVGVDTNARDGWDPLDLRQPPSSPGSKAALALANHDWSTRPGTYRQDVRRASADGHAWPVELVSLGHEGEIAITLEPLSELPADLTLRLVDEEMGSATDLRESTHRVVVFGPGRAYRLTLLAGSTEYVDLESARRIEIPSAVELDQNAPNPFNAATRIRFGLPGRVAAQLEIYNLRGERIATPLPRRVLSAGHHSVVWLGRDHRGQEVASGVYVYRLVSELGVITRRLLLVK